ncbi:MAG: nucleotide exchange factor GrpE [bacterium]|nr:nucleotide exchange factor GrpE [bacterium]
MDETMLNMAQTNEDNLEEQQPIEMMAVAAEQEEKQTTDLPLQEIKEKLDITTELLETLSKQFRDRISYDEKQEKIVDSMHAELQNYRNDMYAMLLKPLLVDIIEVVDNIRKAGIAFARKGDAEKLASTIITDFIIDLHTLLNSYGVEVYKGTPGDNYTPIQQRIVSIVSTNKPELNSKIAESLGFGYIYKGKVIWAEKVKTYKYQSSID